MINLDNKESILKSQGGDTVLKSVNALPDQLQQAFAESQQISFPEDYKNVHNVVVCGMGGSRFPAIIIRELFKDVLYIPYQINDDYNLPGFVNNNTLVILSSYSGTTEEVIICGQKAKEKGAKIAGIAIGGETSNFLKKNNFPAYIFDPKYNPSGQPRIGFGYNVGAHLGFLCKLGLIDISPTIIKTAIQNLTSLLKSFTIDVPTNINPAKQLAKKVFGKYPYYIVSEFLTGVGNAVANQTNETAKSISSFRIIPELNHHLMEGLKYPKELRDIGLFVFFYSALYSPPIQKRFHITKDVVEQNNLETVWHELKGSSNIEQVFELMGLGSYLSMYLAVLYEQDPTVIPYVDYFKKRLKELK
jgi:glucose/mannose-6-phosphate isomerase